jgi:hypothetical protein
MLHEAHQCYLAEGEQTVGSELAAAADGEDDVPRQFRRSTGSPAVIGDALGELDTRLPIQD